MNTCYFCCKDLNQEVAEDCDEERSNELGSIEETVSTFKIFLI